MLASRWDAIYYNHFPVVSLRSTTGYMLPCLRHENHQTKASKRENESIKTQKYNKNAS
jgi:hypothetical protein